LAIICESDWYEHYAPLARAELPPRFVQAVDQNRLIRGIWDYNTGDLIRETRRNVSPRPDPRAHLGVYRETLLEPAWKPHICCVRRERPKRHVDLWELGIQVGDLIDEEVRCIDSSRYLRTKAAILTEELQTNTRPKILRRIEKDIADALRGANYRDRDLPRVRRDLRKARRQWLKMASKRRVSVAFEPGAEIAFEFHESPRTNGRHWWFDVRCNALHAVRKAFGLRPKVYPAPHLTFAVKDGLEDREPD